MLFYGVCPSSLTLCPYSLSLSVRPLCPPSLTLCHPLSVPPPSLSLLFLALCPSFSLSVPPRSLSILFVPPHSLSVILSLSLLTLCPSSFSLSVPPHSVPLSHPVTALSFLSFSILLALPPPGLFSDGAGLCSISLACCFSVQWGICSSNMQDKPQVIPPSSMQIAS